MSDYTLSVNISGDSASLDNAVQKAERSISNFEKRTANMSAKLDTLGSKLQGIGAKWSIGVTLPVGIATKKMIQSASDFEENINKVDVAFGKNAEEVKKWSNTAIEQFGLSKNQALEMTSLFGDMGTSMGLTQGEASKMSTSLAGLAGDMASFKNVSIDEAMTALNGVFTGETESLKRMGVVMTEVNLEEFAAKTGKVYKNMSQAEKVQLRYNYVMEMTKNAHGDYARTADGTANSLRTFQGSVDNLAVAFGQQLLPTITPLVQKATDLINKFAQLSPNTQQIILKMALLAAAVGPVSTVLGTLSKGVGMGITAFSTMATSTSGLIVGLRGVDTKLDGTSGKFQTLGKTIRNLPSIASSGLSTLSTMISTAGKSISIATQGMATSLRAVATSAYGAVAPFLPIIAVIGAIAGAMVLLWNTNDGFKESMIQSWAQIKEAFMPVLETLGVMVTNVIGAITPAIQSIVAAIEQLVTSLAPVVTMLVTTLAPIIAIIVATIGQVVTSIVSALIPVVQTIVNIISTYVIPIITKIITVVASVIESVMNIISPIISFIASVIGKVVEVISTIIGKVSAIFKNVKSIITTIWSAIKTTIGTVMSAIISIIKKITAPVRTVFNGVKSIVINVFNAVKNAWSKLTGIVNNVVSGIASSFVTLTNTIKSIINTVIRAINGAISIINKIPGVEISKIPQLQHGTDNWQGGFAYMHEGGRGELTYLPNGSQVIPHDISVKYAKEAARANTQSGIDAPIVSLEGMVVQVVNNTTVDGTPLKEIISDYTINKIGNSQRTKSRMRGYAY